MNNIARIVKKPPVQEALDVFQNNLDEALNLAIEVQQIPSPTFHEKKRADFVQSRFLNSGLVDVQQDEIHNVFGRFPGADPDLPPVIVSAHIDTVFAQSIDLTVSHANGQGENRLYGPGLADNSMGVAGILLLADVLRRFNIRPQADIWFVANVAEEGLGDLKGMRAVVERFGQAGAYIVVEGGSYGHIFHGAIGVRRYRVTVRTDGGHSWGNFGSPSAIHILGRFIAAIDDVIVPRKPKTS
ncbi:MAG: M20/M25/M40 family metallo-hydrolase, partial [Phycisphaerae bacterium]|nr:M20/M25/M40 family metallo-hydrolase [Phycisphaerae bacterium]NIX31244.1 M20/M25/M40 family metallo-hydrolase [Phycisphaerae bacterium]